MIQMLSPDPSSPFQIIEEDPMLIRLASVMVENQDSALRFYTTILGFVEPGHSHGPILPVADRLRP
jgi:hypothetical protein